MKTSLTLLAFHEISLRKHRYTIDPALFFEFVGSLQKNPQNQILSFRDLKNQKFSPEKKLFILTFDDNREGFLKHAYPFFEKLKIPSSQFVVKNFLERILPPPAERYSYFFTKEAIPDFSPALVEWGYHGKSHVDARHLTDAEFQEEFIASRNRLSEELKIPLDLFAYPGGLCSEDTHKKLLPHYDFVLLADGKTESVENSLQKKILSRVLITQEWLESHFKGPKNSLPAPVFGPLAPPRE